MALYAYNYSSIISQILHLLISQILHLLVMETDKMFEFGPGMYLLMTHGDSLSLTICHSLVCEANLTAEQLNKPL